MKPTFYENLITNLNNKKLSPSSIQLYIRNLKKLNNNEDIKNFNFLKKPEDIIDKIKDLKDNTKRQYLISIVSSLNSFTTDIQGVKHNKYKLLTNKYYKYMIDIDKKIKETPTIEMTEVQKNNWLTWDQVIEIYDKIKSEIKLNKKKITETMFNKLLKYVILSLYVLIPPRRNLDWQKMLIITTSNKDSIEDKKYNYLDIPNKQFIFNVYKTSSKYGETKIPIPEKLMEILELYINNHPLYDKKNKKQGNNNIPLLVYYNGKPFEKVNSITRILNKIFNKKISSSMLRHIFLSSKYSKDLNEREKDAKMMGHSLQTQKEYIKQSTQPKASNDIDIIVHF